MGLEMFFLIKAEVVNSKINTLRKIEFCDPDAYT